MMTFGDNGRARGRDDSRHAIREMLDSSAEDDENSRIAKRHGKKGALPRLEEESSG